MQVSHNPRVFKGDDVKAAESKTTTTKVCVGEPNANISHNRRIFMF
jgi:hypothetical protein